MNCKYIDSIWYKINRKNVIAIEVVPQKLGVKIIVITILMDWKWSIVLGASLFNYLFTIIGNSQYIKK